MVLRKEADRAQKTGNTAKKSGIPAFPALVPAAANGRKTVCKTPPARHKKFLGARETWLRQPPSLFFAPPPPHNKEPP
jgi:hypothetical protein